MRAATTLVLLLSMAGCSGMLTGSDLPLSGTDSGVPPLPPGTDASVPPGIDASLPPGTDSGTPELPGADSGTPEFPGTDSGTPPIPGTDGGTVEPPPPIPGSKVVGYFSAWSVYDRNYHIADIPADVLTHLNYAFLNIQGGRCVLGDPYADIDRAYPGDSFDSGALRGNFRRIQLLKQQRPSLRALLSIGGWTWSGSFSDIAKTDAGRRTLATSCIDIMVQYGFDGIDVDWEFPVSGGLDTNSRSPDDRHNYTLLLEEFRRQLVARAASQGRTEPYLLTIASGQSPEAFANLELPELGRVLDWINLMSYDYHGAWEMQTGHNAPMVIAPGEREGWGVQHAVDLMIAGGVPPGKIVMGVPFYGRSWIGVSAGNGLRQPATGAGPGSWEAGVIDWKDIAANYLTNAAFVQSWDEMAQVPYLFNRSTGVFVTYDDPRSIRIKRDFARRRGLGGVMIWELNNDDAQHTLTRALTGN